MSSFSGLVAIGIKDIGMCVKHRTAVVLGATDVL
jgi:hypothetical protein